MEREYYTQKKGYYLKQIETFIERISKLQARYIKENGGSTGAHIRYTLRDGTTGEGWVIGYGINHEDNVVELIATAKQDGTQSSKTIPLYKLGGHTITPIEPPTDKT